MNTIPITTARMAAVATLIGGILLGGCETASPRRDPVRTNTAAEDARIDHRPAGITAEPVASTVIDARPAAIVNGRTVTWGELRPALNELAGAAALQEHILDRELAGLLAGAGLVIGEADTSRERRRMLDALDADPETAIRLLRELRDRDGLGDARFASLLYRNAALRALVAPEVRVTEDAVQEMFEVLHGAKRQVRVMVVPTFAVAERMLQRLQAGESFADLAVAHSTDSSAPRGGLLEPISRNNPAYPASLRSAMWKLRPGEHSAPILEDNGYMLLSLVREVPADGTSLGEVRSDLQEKVRRNVERLRMDELARRILSNASITIFDEHLQFSWTRQRQKR